MTRFLALGVVLALGMPGVASAELLFNPGFEDVDRSETNAEADVQVGREYFDITNSTKLGETLVTMDLDNPNFIMTGTAVAGIIFVRPIVIFSNSVGTPDGSENVFIFDASLTEVPEPGSLLLLGAGATLLLRRKSAA